MKFKHPFKYEAWKIGNNYYVVRNSKRVFNLFYKYILWRYYPYGVNREIVFLSNSKRECMQFLLSNYGTPGILIDAETIKEDKNGNIIIF